MWRMLRFSSEALYNMLNTQNDTNDSNKNLLEFKKQVGEV